jgi:hypothetical protein
MTLPGVQKILKKPIFIRIFLGILILVILFLLYEQNHRYTPIQKKELANSTYCAVNSDCALYDCSNCGNRLWLETNNIKIDDCNKKVNNLIGCGCVGNVCKRIYKK